MPSISSTRPRQALAVLAAAAVVMGCSSDSVTGPTTRDNAALVLHFDSLMNSASGDRAGIYSDIGQMLAEGAPVNTGTFLLNNVPSRMHMAAQLIVSTSNGTAVDSEYVLAAWKGDGSDSAIVFIQSGGTVLSLWAFGGASSAEIGGSATVVPGPLGASCTPFTAPSDIYVPTPLSCHVQPTTNSFEVVLGTGQVVGVSNQPIEGIRVEVESPPPPC